MSNWEYKVISSGKGGFASPALMEKFINDLGQEQWEIIGFHTAPDNALAFTGLARRPTQRDWTLEDAAKAAARAEADKLRAEFEAKFKAATSGAGTGAAAEEQGETFLAEEKAGADDGLRRLRDTSRDDDPDAPEDENGNGQKDDWDKLAAEDELPTFFDAMRPHMRRNQRGPGMSVGVDFLAKKWRLEEADVKGALVECGMQIPADENARPVYVEYEGDLYWVNINRRGEIWINTREKPEPVFRVVQAKRVEDSAEPPAVEAAAPAGNYAPEPVEATEQKSAPIQRGPRERPYVEPSTPQAAGPKTFLDKIRGMMRRNRRGNGLSGSFQYLTKALKIDDAQLVGQLAEHGLRLPEGDQRTDAEAGDFVYWLNKNQRGEIWINAELKRRGPPGRGSESPGREAANANGESGAVSGRTGAEEPGSSDPEAPASAPVTAPEPAPAPSSTFTPSTLPPENTLTAVRLLMQPKKRGEGVTALLSELAQKLEKTPEQLQAALAGAGLLLPESPKSKPTFTEFGGEIYWLNANARGEVWLNAKQANSARKSRAKKTDE